MRLNAKHTSEFDTFTIQETPLTQLQWFMVNGDNPSAYRRKEDSDGDYERINGIPVNMDHPVENVSWEDSQGFISKLNRWDDHCSYRLLTEMEWEVATRAHTDTGYFFGDDAGGEKGTILDQYAWFSGLNKQNRTHAVARKKPNPNGFYDMIGNVRQWVQDWYGPYTELATLLALHRSQSGPASGTNRVMRGGSWDSLHPEDLRSAKRDFADPKYKNPNLGLRLMRPCNAASSKELKF